MTFEWLALRVLLGAMAVTSGAVAVIAWIVSDESMGT